MGKVYAQIYSLLRTNQKDLVKSLKELSEIGYDGVELMGTYTAGMTIPTYRQLLTDLKLDPLSSHGLRNEQDYDIAHEIGVRYTDIRPDVDDNGLENVLQQAEAMNEAGKLRAKHGLHGIIHNHSQELRWIKGEEGKRRVYDVLLANTDPEYVGFEFDVGWGAFAGADPVAIIKQYPGRFPLIHVKEATRTAQSDAELEHFPDEVLALGDPIFPENPQAGHTGIERGFSFFTAEQGRMLYNARTWNGKLGEGIIDWPALRDACEVQGTIAYVNEREWYGYPGGNDDPYIGAKDDCKYLRSLGL